MTIRTAVAIYLFLGLCPGARGCKYTIRDLGFVDIVSSPYQLLYFIENDTPDSIVASFRQISTAVLHHSNVESDIINVDRSRNFKAMDYFQFWEIQKCPAAILVAPDGRSIILPCTGSKESLKEAMWTWLEPIISSPARNKIQELAVRAHSFILFFNGNNVAETGQVRKLVTRMSYKIGKQLDPLPVRIDLPPQIIEIARQALPYETILLWSLGLTDNDIDEPMVAILYGKGKQLGPLLKGKEITERNIYNILSIIGLSCECGLNRDWILGRFMPLRWDGQMQAKVVQNLGFDPENPMVKMAMNHILFSGNKTVNKNGFNLDELSKITGGYNEEILAYDDKPGAGRVSPAAYSKLVSGESLNSKISPGLKGIFSILLIFALLILLVSSFMLFKEYRRNAG